MSEPAGRTRERAGTAPHSPVEYGAVPRALVFPVTVAACSHLRGDPVRAAYLDTVSGMFLQAAFWLGMFLALVLGDARAVVLADSEVNHYAWGVLIGTMGQKDHEQVRDASRYARKSMTVSTLRADDRTRTLTGAANG